MSAGSPITAVYVADLGGFFPITIQPETLTLTLNSVANEAGTGPIPQGAPSAKVSGGRRSLGINARLVRFRFTGVLPPGYNMNGILTLPVLQPTVFAGYGRGQTGTYTLNGTDYDIAFVGKTPEKIN